MNPRLLLVEDEAGLRLTLSDRLASEGYAVETADDGRDGLDRAARDAYDIIVLDVMLPHIFKPFYRGRRALDAEVRGSGVGLSVVSHVVNAHRGRIHVDSRPAQGTTVVVELPAAT